MLTAMEKEEVAGQASALLQPSALAATYAVEMDPWLEQTRWSNYL